MKEQVTKISIIGVDMAKNDFVAAFDGKRSAKFSNNAAGFLSFSEALQKLEAVDFCVIMEATGVYHLRFARFLLSQNVKVIVCNPQRINNYRKTFTPAVKTDRRDAHVLQDFGWRNAERLRAWNPPPFEVEVLQQRQSALEGLKADRLSVSNRLHALAHWPQPDEKSIAALEAILLALDSQIQTLEDDLDADTRLLFEPQLKLLESIPGVGPAISRYIVVLTNGFQGFTSAKQLIAFLGLAPKIYESGQFRGRSPVSKMGSSTARRLLYLGSWTAFR